jgi:hypothetical protein
MCENEQCVGAIARLARRDNDEGGQVVLVFSFLVRNNVRSVLGAFKNATAVYRSYGPTGTTNHYAVWLADGVLVQAHPTDDRREPIEAPECAPYTVEVPL